MDSFLDTMDVCEYENEQLSDLRRSSMSSLAVKTLQAANNSYYSPSSYIRSSLSVMTNNCDSKHNILSPTSFKNNKKTPSFFNTSLVFGYFEKLDKSTNAFLDLFVSYDLNKNGFVTIDDIIEITKSMNLKYKKNELLMFFEEFQTPEGIDYLRAYRQYQQYLRSTTIYRQKRTLIKNKERSITERHSITFPLGDSSYTPSPYSCLNTPSLSEDRDSCCRDSDLHHLTRNEELSEVTSHEGIQETLFQIVTSAIKSLDIPNTSVFEEMLPVDGFISLDSLYNYVNTCTYIPYSLSVFKTCFEPYCHTHRDSLSEDEFLSFMRESKTSMETHVNYIIDTFQDDFGGASLHIPMSRSCLLSPPTALNPSCRIQHSTSITTNLYQLPMFDSVCKDADLSTDEDDAISF